MARAIVSKPRLLLLENNFLLFSKTERRQILNFILDRKHPLTVVLTSSFELDIHHLIDAEFVLYNGQIINSK